MTDGVRERALFRLGQLRRHRKEPCVECEGETRDTGDLFCERCRHIERLREAGEDMALAFIDEGPLPP